MKLIDKDKVEEILRNLWKKDDGHNPEHRICYNKALQEVQIELDTIKMEEVDLEKEIKKSIYNCFSTYATVDDMVYIAKHFFELGLKAKGE